MRTKGSFLTIAVGAAGAITLLGQGQGQPGDPRRTPGVQAGQDPNRMSFVMANCKNLPTAPADRGPVGGARGGPGGLGGPGGGAGRGPATSQEYNVTAIPGVIAAGQRWKILWEDTGNNADGIVAMDDGSLLLAQNDKSDVIKIDKDGQASVAYTDTYTGGALAANAKGQLFIAERALPRSIWLLKPQRRLFADMKDGEPLECLGPGVLNDLTADSKGGVYMTMGGVYYANPRGGVNGRYGTVGGNGIILSRDEKTLYVTGRVGANRGGGPGGGGAPGSAPGSGGAAGGQAPVGGGRGAREGAAGGRGAGANGGLVAFDVQSDGSLVNERQFADVCGDGSTVDAEGRIYCTGGPGGAIGVVSPEGKLLGAIPAPRNLISLAFGGPDKKTLYGVTIRDVQVMSIQMIAQGYKKRPK
jgi:gluconolactonase